MNTTIGVYADHTAAVEAVKQLKQQGFPPEHLTIMGKTETEEVDKKTNVTPEYPINVAGVGVGTAVGTALGVLTGVGVLAIPGVGFLYGAGALIGAVAGFDFGLIGGGIATWLANMGVKDENARKYNDALMEGKFLLIAHGDEKLVDEARHKLAAIGGHEQVAKH
ncbi:MAG: hypothetical protein KF744_06015 [Taibaiella sp.]|nr:hypothetical protein [Taibaiella sp.]